MKYKKSMIMIILAIFLITIAASSASDVNDGTTASEDTLEIELTHDSGIEENSVAAESENQKLTTDYTVDGDDFESIQTKINQASAGARIFLGGKNYTGTGQEIVVDKSVTIIGGSAENDNTYATLDAKEASRIMKVTADNVVLKGIIFTKGKTEYDGVDTESGCGGAIYGEASAVNCTFKDNHAISGGAMCQSSAVNCTFKDNHAISGGAIYDGSAVNCTFKDNHASNGGAIYDGSAVNCTFNNNHVSDCGGAMCQSSAVNCTFNDNHADGHGGAMIEVSAVNCIFNNNEARFYGGAMSEGSADTCIFKTASDTTDNTEILQPTLNVDNFTTVYKSGEKLTFDLKTNSGMPVTNGNIQISLYYTNDTWFGNFSCLSGEGWSLDLPIGSYYAIFNTSYEKFTPIQRTITVTPLPPKHTFWALNNTINANDNETINLTNDFYFDSTYDSAFVNGIVINRPVTINGNGCTINANGKARIFNVAGSNVILKDINFINANTTGNGGAVYFDKKGSTINCNFTNNTANNGGAIYFNGEVNNVKVIGSFKSNTAERAGGAIYVKGKSLNSNFTSQFDDNKAKQASGGAIFFLSLAENNTFEGIFKDNYALYGGSIFFYNKANNNRFNSNFTSNVAKSCGGAMFFYNTTNSNNFTGHFTNNAALGQVSETVGNGGAITFKDVSTNCRFTGDFTNNTAALYGGAVNYRQSPQNITFNSNFTENEATTGGGVNFFESFENVIFNAKFSKNTALKGGAIAAGEGIIKDVFFNSNRAEYGGAIFFTGAGNVTNCKFTNNSALFGGAIEIDGNGTVTNCNFTDNKATDIYSCGGAIYFDKTANVLNCNFTNNQATSDYGYGGAIWINDEGNVENCNFTGNIAASGSAVSFWNASATKTVSNSCFLNNRANAELLKLSKNDNNITITFTGGNNLLNAIFSNGDVSFTNVTYWGVNGIATTDSSTPVRSNKEAGQNISVCVVVNGEIVSNKVYRTDENGMIVLDIKAGDAYYISARHDTDSYYTEAVKTISNNLNVNVESQTSYNKTVNITAKSNIPNEIIDGKLMFILPNGTINASYAGNGIWWAIHTFADYGDYKITATYTGLDKVTVTNATVSVKIQTQIATGDINATYNTNKDLVITLKDGQGKALSGFKVTVDLNGVREYVTDANGQVKVQTKGLAPKTYTAKITFNGDTTYEKTFKEVKVTVQKATPKIIAKKKTYKAKAVKKFTITLKDNTGKPIKKAKVRLFVKKIAKKTKKIKTKKKAKKNIKKTNKKGKATFKIDRTKKGKYWVTVKFYGNKYFKAITKKVKITIK